MFIILGLIGGFAGGFILANKLNASEIATLRSQSVSTNSNSAKSTDDTLGNDEIESKIAEADKNPTNFDFQKNLGISLYRYAAMKQQPELIERSMRILERANSLNAKDADVLTTLGNAQFDLGFARKDLALFEKARASYQQALTIKPNDADVQTDLGISYFVQEPPEYDKAVLELQKVAAGNPKHTRALQFLTRAYLKQGKVVDAERTMDKIIEIAPSDPSITELRAAISDAKGKK